MKLAERTGLEPATPGVTGRYSNQLNYRSELRARIIITLRGVVNHLTKNNFPSPNSSIMVHRTARIPLSDSRWYPPLPPPLLEQRLVQLQQTPPHLLSDSLIGLEKESLRVDRRGEIAQTPHPVQLGSTLTHPWITTDYSEALLEFITPPLGSAAAAIQFLADSQQFVYRQLSDERLWATSMPCVIPGESSIPLAWYGSSCPGMMKHIYRRGLGYRYGRTMQVIAGIHYNYSFSEPFWQQWQQLVGERGELRHTIDRHYMALIRNLLRLGWLIPYLFGASPAVCRSFLGGKPSSLLDFDTTTAYEPFATSLRMGDIGYQNNKENEHGIKANYDSLAEYIATLRHAIETPCDDYQRIGVVVGGEYRQLNANILQIENEYYSTVRPKQLLQSRLEKPINALRDRGIRYIELRSLDINPFDPVGVNVPQLHFIEALLLYSLLSESPPISRVEQRAIDANEMLTAHRGREPGLYLQRDGRPQLLQQWALEVVDQMVGVCELLDRGHADQRYQQALAQQRALILDPERTPSAQMLAQMRERDEGFHHFASRISQQHQQYFCSRAVNREHEQRLAAEAVASLERQAALEASDDGDMARFLQRYFSEGGAG